MGTDYIDLYQLHGFDALSPIEETLSALDDMVQSGKVRYVGCSNFSGWHLMKSLAISENQNLGAVDWSLSPARRQTRRLQRDNAYLSLLAPAGFHGAESAAGWR